MDRVQLVNAALADILKGAYVAARYTLYTLATATGINYRTLQRIMAGEAPVTMGQLESIANAVNRDPQDLFEDALKKADRDELSEASGTPDALTQKRNLRDAAKAAEGSQQWTEPSAATTKQRNPQLGSDETPAP